MRNLWFSVKPSEISPPLPAPADIYFPFKFIPLKFHSYNPLPETTVRFSLFSILNSRLNRFKKSGLRNSGIIFMNILSEQAFMFKQEK